MDFNSNLPLTEFQTIALRGLVAELTELKVTDYKISSNDDEEILIWKRTEETLTNIIINPDELITFSHINIKWPRAKDELSFRELDGVKEVALKFKNVE